MLLIAFLLVCKKNSNAQTTTETPKFYFSVETDLIFGFEHCLTGVVLYEAVIKRA